MCELKGSGLARQTTINVACVAAWLRGISNEDKGFFVNVN